MRYLGLLLTFRLLRHCHAHAEERQLPGPTFILGDPTVSPPPPGPPVPMPTGFSLLMMHMRPLDQFLGHPAMFISHACYIPFGAPTYSERPSQVHAGLDRQRRCAGSLLRPSNALMPFVGAAAFFSLCFRDRRQRCGSQRKVACANSSSSPSPSASAATNGGTTTSATSASATDRELQQTLQEMLEPAQSFLSSGLVDRALEAKLLLLAALAGEHLLLIGPPGTAKSLLCRRLATLGSARYFERLLTRFSTPDEVFGPLSLTALQEDRLERRVARYLPDAEVAFLDEVFKANSAILNTLLTLLNERVYDNGGDRCEAPLWCVVGASNEIPAEGNLDALFDRFLLKRFVKSVSDAQARALLAAAAAPTAVESVEPPTIRLSPALGREVRAAASRVVFPPRLLQMLARLRKFLQEEVSGAPVQISDRRLAKAAQLVQIVAFAAGGRSVSELDLLCLQYVLWDRDPEISKQIRNWLLAAFAPKATGGEVGDIQVEGAGRSDMDGIYEFVGDRNGKRSYVQQGGPGAIYFDLFWKLCDGTWPGGPGRPPWYQSIEDMEELEPPTGGWSTCYAAAEPSPTLWKVLDGSGSSDNPVVRASIRLESLRRRGKRPDESLKKDLSSFLKSLKALRLSRLEVLSALQAVLAPERNLMRSFWLEQQDIADAESMVLPSAHEAVGQVERLLFQAEGLQAELNNRAEETAPSSACDRVVSANAPLATEASNQAICAVNVLASIFYLDQALVEIYGATMGCERTDTGDERIGCAGNIFGILQSFVNTGSWIAGLVTQCSNVTDLPADCASVVLSFPGNIFEALEAGLDAVSGCQPAQAVLNSSRRLLRDRGWSKRFSDFTSPAPPAPIPRQLAPGLGSPEEKLDAAWCQVHVTQAAVYFAQAGVFIDVAARFGCTNTTGALNQASCAATVTLIIAAIANVVSYLSGAAQRCGDTVQMGICGSDAGSIANAIAGIANGGASLLGTCQQIASRGWEKLQEFRQLEQPPVPGLKLGQQLSFV
ncbi:ravA [Symbiodinium microadriaticum]|nr:ravA [Symbiodinium microadriaticum]CAE7894392.1 ravA [Symbiodinium sp. KB8]